MHPYTQVYSNAKLQCSKEGIRNFQERKFGLTFHWGAYSGIDRSEWALYEDRYDIDEYAEMAMKFNPSKFNAEAWVKLAVAAGQKMLAITTKHHDGFCLYDSKLTDFKITNTPFGRDPMHELAEACAKFNVDLHFYYSLLDWHHPSYVNDWDIYLEYYHGQVRELCTNYGKIGGMIFDGYWPSHSQYITNPELAHFSTSKDWKLGELYDMIHTLQPDAAITNNIHIDPLPGEDYQTFEQDLPGENKSGFGSARVKKDFPLASWITMNNSWNYRSTDKEFKTVGHIIKSLLISVGRGANFLLNIGPDEQGILREDEMERLYSMGRWLQKNGEAVYGCHPIKGFNVPWGYVMQKENAVYLYVLHYPGKVIELKNLPIHPATAKTMKGCILKVETDGEKTKIHMPYAPHNPIGTIIQLI